MSLLDSDLEEEIQNEKDNENVEEICSDLEIDIPNSSLADVDHNKEDPSDPVEDEEEHKGKVFYEYSEN